MKKQQIQKEKITAKDIISWVVTIINAISNFSRFI